MNHPTQFNFTFSRWVSSCSLGEKQTNKQTNKTKHTSAQITRKDISHHPACLTVTCQEAKNQFISRKWTRTAIKHSDCLIPCLLWTAMILCALCPLWLLQHFSFLSIFISIFLSCPPLSSIFILPAPSPSWLLCVHTFTWHRATFPRFSLLHIWQFISSAGSSVSAQSKVCLYFTFKFLSYLYLLLLSHFSYCCE